MDLVHALPNGPGPTFESGDFSMPVMEPNTKLGDGEFPCDSVEAFVDDVMGPARGPGPHLSVAVRTVVFSSDAGRKSTVG
jgi:hypothetical protein